MGPLIALLFIALSTNQLFVACINSLIAAIPFHFLRLENQFLYTSKQAIMPHAAPVAATDVVAVDPKAPETRKSYDIKTKRIFVQTIEQLVSSSKSCRVACAYAGIPTLYYRRWKSCSQRLTMSTPRMSLWRTAQKAQLVKFIMGIQVF